MATALRRSRFRIVVAETCTDSDGLRAVFNKPKTNIDIALIASHLREGPVEGLKVLRDMRSAYPKTGFIALLDSSARAIVVEAFRAGATGILSREEPFDTVCKCILAVHQGQIWASVRELKFALEALAQSEGSATTAEKITNGGLCLTKREEGVVQLVAEGLTNRDISRS